MGMVRFQPLHCLLQKPLLDRQGDDLVLELLVDSLKNQSTRLGSRVPCEAIGN